MEARLEWAVAAERVADWRRAAGQHREIVMAETSREEKPKRLRRLRARLAEGQARHADRRARRKARDIEGAARQAESGIYKGGFFTTKH